MINFFELGIQKYWAPASTISPDTRRIKLEQAIASNNYIWSEKFDGNFLRAVITPERNALQTRGISTITKTYGEVQEKVYFWDSIVSAFSKGTTVLLGEGYIPGGIDATVGSILRSLPPKALARQKDIKLEYRIFDVLALDDISFLDKPIEERIKSIPTVVQRINNPLVKAVSFHNMDETFFDSIGEIFARGGEGAVCYKKGILYMPGKRSSAWTTIKVKQEISSEIDAFITDIVPGEKMYTGKDLGTWQLWENQRTGEKVVGSYFGEYQHGGTYIPITKNYFNNWPAAIQVSVLDRKGNEIPLCKVSGITEEFKTSLRDDPDRWIGCPVTIGGMMVSSAKADSEGNGISIRHPLLKRIREGDLLKEDCTLAKIFD